MANVAVDGAYIYIATELGVILSNSFELCEPTLTKVSILFITARAAKLAPNENLHEFLSAKVQRIHKLIRDRAAHLFVKKLARPIFPLNTAH